MVIEKFTLFHNSFEVVCYLHMSCKTLSLILADSVHNSLEAGYTKKIVEWRVHTLFLTT